MENENKENNSDKSSGFFKIAISVVTITTPLIYLIGLNYYAGVLSGYGVSSSLFSFSIEENLTGAYYFLVITMFDSAHQEKFFLIIASIASITILVGLALLFIELVLKKLYVFIRSKLAYEGYDKKEEFNKLKKDNFVDSKGISFTLLVMLIMVLPASAYVIGKDSSTELVEDFKNNKCTPKEPEIGWNRCVTVIDNKNGTVETKGLLITASKNRIAIYSDNKSRIINYSDEYELLYEYEGETKK